MRRWVAEFARSGRHLGNCQFAWAGCILRAMDALLAVLVGYIFLCIVFPRLLHSRVQYFAAVAAVGVAILLRTLAMVGTPLGGFWTLMEFFAGILQLGAFVLLVLATGGLSIGELAGEFAEAWEAMRRGSEEDKPVVVPLTGDRCGPGAGGAGG